MPAYYAMGYLSGVLCSVTTIKEHPHAKTPNARGEPPRHVRTAAWVQATIGAVGSSALLD